jgi:hypothetical protein
LVGEIIRAAAPPANTVPRDDTVTPPVVDAQPKDEHKEEVPNTSGCEKVLCVAPTSINVDDGLYVIGGECRKGMGARVNDIALKVMGESSNIEFDSVEEEVGVSFSCLALAQAMQESCLSHCVFEGGVETGDYCEGDIDFIIKGDAGDSIGVMQISSKWHKSVMDGRDQNIYSFEDNVEYGLQYLVHQYKGCGKHWKGALTAYNAGPGNCREDSVYVEKVLKRVDEVKKMFPEICGGVVPDGDPSDDTGDEVTQTSVSIEDGDEVLSNEVKEFEVIYMNGIDTAIKYRWNDAENGIEAQVYKRAAFVFVWGIICEWGEECSDIEDMEQIGTHSSIFGIRTWEGAISMAKDLDEDDFRVRMI